MALCLPRDRGALRGISSGAWETEATRLCTEALHLTAFPLRRLSSADSLWAWECSGCGGRPLQTPLSDGGRAAFRVGSHCTWGVSAAAGHARPHSSRARPRGRDQPPTTAATSPPPGVRRDPAVKPRAEKPHASSPSPWGGNGGGLMDRTGSGGVP